MANLDYIGPFKAKLVATNAARLALPLQRLDPGNQVFVIATGETWEVGVLAGSPLNDPIKEWKLIASGGAPPFVSDDWVRYLDAVAGSDVTGDGLTQATAWQTFAKARTEAPLAGRGARRLELASGPGQDYAWPAGDGISGKTWKFVVGIETNPTDPTLSGARPFVIRADLVLESTEVSTAITASSAFTSAGAFVVDEWKGATVRSTSGGNNGFERTVKFNDLNTLTFQRNFPGGFAVGDTIEIYRPGATITAPAGASEAISLNGGDDSSLGVSGIRFVGRVIFESGEIVRLDRCEIDGPYASFAFRGSRVSVGSIQDPDVWDSRVNNASLYVHGDVADGGSFIAFRESTFTGAVVADNYRMLALTGANMELIPYDGENSPIQYDSGSYGFATFFAVRNLVAGFPYAEEFGTGTVSAAFHVSGGCVAVFPFFGDLDNNGTDAVLVNDASDVIAGFIDGTGNSGYGIRATGGSQFRGDSITVTGTLGDIGLGLGSRRETGVASFVTIGAVTQDSVILDPHPEDESVDLVVRAVATRQDHTAAAGFEWRSSSRRAGAVAPVVSGLGPAFGPYGDAALAGVTGTTVASVNNLNSRVTGVALEDLNWVLTWELRRSPGGIVRRSYANVLGNSAVTDDEGNTVHLI